MIAGLRLLLLLAYLPLAHFAGTLSSPLLAAIALGDVVLMLLIEPLCALRPWAWLIVLATIAMIALLVESHYVMLPLLLMPVLFISAVSLWFSRSLLPGRVPLITRIVAAIYGQTLETLSPQHHRYARRLTFAWALLLGVLAVFNLLLALIAVPNGVFARFGIAAPITLTQAQWSLFANVFNYGIVGGFMLIEFQWRKRVFTERPYRNFVEFMQRLAALGPVFWRDLFR